MAVTNAPKLGILAGGGAAPRQLIAACQALDRPFFVVCLEGHAEPDLAGAGVPHEVLPLGAFARLKELCEREKIEDIIMLGRVRRPSVAELKPDWLTLKILTKIGMNALGDDGLLRGVGKALEDECGVRLVGVADVFADLLAPEGTLTTVVPDELAQEDIRRAVEIASTLGRLDVGQAVIVQQGIILGVEAVEGTDALIERSLGVRRDGGGGVLVKIAKPQQDNRFDLPTIGIDTVRHVHAAGLAGIAVEAGRSLILEREKTIEAADMLGVFIVGLPLNGAENG
ncbi:MAG: UDP-2,3-diacylglucosamine diphosphatase LpxI [Bdellovibrionales bacterium]|jgi:hypothetical protein